MTDQEWEEFVKLPFEERVRREWEMSEAKKHDCMSLAKSRTNYTDLQRMGRFTCDKCGKRWQLANVFPGNYWETV